MKHQILELILNRPNIRTVEIADRLDMEPDAVRPHIADEIKSGIIVEEPIVAPNGRTVQSFRYATAKPQAVVVTEALADPLPARVLRALPPTERPLAERERPLSSRPAGPPPRATDPLSLAVSPAHAAPELTQAAAEPLDIVVPVTRKEGVPLIASSEAPAARKRRAGPPTKIELAIECLRAASGEPVPSEMLARAMGLLAKQHPAAYLRDALLDGRVSTALKMWTLGPASGGQPQAAVELPAPAVKPRVAAPVSPEPAAPVFPRADPVALAAYEPGSKRCTMNCGTHADDPRSAAERALLCDDCEQVARLEEALAETAPATEAEWIARAESDNQADFTPPIVADQRDSTADAWIAAAEDAPVARHDLTGPASILGGLPSLSGIFVPIFAGKSEMGGMRTQPSLVASASTVTSSENAPLSAASPVRDTAAERFLAGVMSDGSLHLRIPGRAPFDLEPEHARELWKLMMAHGYAAWQAT